MSGLYFRLLTWAGKGVIDNSVMKDSLSSAGSPGKVSELLINS